MLKNNSLYNILLNDENVNTYTKVLIMLNQLHYNHDFYIPNKKLLNICKKYKIKINTRQLQYILINLVSNKLINIFYKGNLRYFNLNYYNNSRKIKDKTYELEEEYDWLGDDK